MNPHLSVCIANYNGEEVLRPCLDSVLSQQCDFEVEVIVHDDASTDQSGKLLRDRYPQVKLIQSEVNCGFCRSNNRMVEQARGNYLLLLNNDTRLHPGALQALSDHATDHPRAGILTLPQYDMDSGQLLDRGMFLDLFANPIPNLDPGQHQVATAMGSCLWLQRDLWTELGGFPEWFGSMAEDMYLCCRARLAGRTVEVVNDSGYDHVVGHSFGGGKVVGGGLDTSYQRRRLSELNKNRVIFLCFPAPANLLILTVQFALLLTEGLLLSLARFSGKPLLQIYLPSITGILGDLPRLYREQRRCAASRQVGLADFFQPVRFWHHKLTLLWRHGMPKIS
jgi:GT2 family glycosyltransferase